MPTQEEYEAAGRLTNPNAGGDCPAASCSLRLIAEMEEAERRYREQQEKGDAISIASTRATFLATRDCLMIFRSFFKANA